MWGNLGCTCNAACSPLSQQRLPSRSQYSSWEDRQESRSQTQHWVTVLISAKAGQGLWEWVTEHLTQWTWWGIVRAGSKRGLGKCPRQIYRKCKEQVPERSLAFPGTERGSVWLEESLRGQIERKAPRGRPHCKAPGHFGGLESVWGLPQRSQANKI